MNEIDFILEQLKDLTAIDSPTPSKILLTTKTKLQLILTSQFFS